MVNSVNKIPSRNLPFTNEQGVIHPIWYEFLRSFIADVGDPTTTATTDNTIIAGSGIEGTGAVATVNVGQGAGILVNENDVAVDINGQVNAQASAEDEILIVDASDVSQIRKTTLQSVSELSPGTVPGGNNTEIQYNNNGEFAGDSGFTTDGSGNLDIEGTVKIADTNGDLTINGAAFSTASSSDLFTFTTPASGDIAYRFLQSGSGAALEFEIKSTVASTVVHLGSANRTTIRYENAQGDVLWHQGTDGTDFILCQNVNLNLNQAFTVSNSTQKFTHHAAVAFEGDVSIETSLLRNTVAGITASTTQTQGNGALTAEVNEISTVASANDTVTLPTAAAGRKVWVINNGANTLQIFPASSDDLGAGANSSTTLTSGSNATFIAYDATNWEQIV